MNNSKTSNLESEPKILTVQSTSQIPLFGLDFLGILDRGTNVLEIKPITICNLRCRYCFVSAGDYKRNFIIEKSFLIEWINRAINLKDCNDIEIHIAPYGEILLYPNLYELISDIRNIPAVKTISLQSNGMLLTTENIQKLSELGVDRLNISLNSMNATECAEFCGVQDYNLTQLLDRFEDILNSRMELLIAPVWFMGLNDKGILEIIKYVHEKSYEGHNWPKLRLGIQNYLTYKTGRKIKKIREREFTYFYHRLQELEKQFNLKLKLGPLDFGIHSTKAISPPVHIEDSVIVEVLCQGRWNNEYIARINPDWAVKLITKHPLTSGQFAKVNLIKGNLSGNLLTAILKE